MTLLKSPPPTKAEDLRKVFEQRIARGAQVINSDGDSRLWRDEYLSGMQNDLNNQALGLLIAATTLEQFNQAKALVIASAKIGDVQQSLVKLAKPAPETKP
jgi:hypothetical protein